MISTFRKERRHFRRPVFRIYRLRAKFEGLDQKEQIEEENHRDQGAFIKIGQIPADKQSGEFGLNF